MAKIQAFVKSKKKKISTKESWYIFFVILLSVALFIMVLFFLKNPLSQNLPINLGQRMIGNTLNLVVEDSGSFSQTIAFNGSLLPNFDVTQECFLTLKTNQQNCKARAKVFMYNDQNQIFNLSAYFTSDWVANVDGYYYYNNEITSDLIVKFLNGIQIPSIDQNLSSSNLYNFIVTVETLPTTADYETLWKLAVV